MAFVPVQLELWQERWGVCPLPWAAQGGDQLTHRQPAASRMKYFSWVLCSRSIINRLLLLRWADFETQLLCSPVPIWRLLKLEGEEVWWGLLLSNRAWFMAPVCGQSGCVELKRQCWQVARRMWAFVVYCFLIYFKILYPHDPRSVVSLGEHMLLPGLPPAESQPWVWCAWHVIPETLPALSQVFNKSSWVQWN